MSCSQCNEVYASGSYVYTTTRYATREHIMMNYDAVNEILIIKFDSSRWPSAVNAYILYTLVLLIPFKLLFVLTKKKKLSLPALQKKNGKMNYLRLKETPNHIRKI